MRSAAINAYASRAQYLLQRSRTSTRVGIFYQLFDYPNGNYIREELVQGVLDDQDAQMPKENGIAAMIMSSKTDVVGDRKWIQETAALAGALVAAGHYPIYFNEDRLLRSHIEGKAVVMGEAAFEALIFYRERSLTVEVAEKLREIAAAGIPILFVRGRPIAPPAMRITISAISPCRRRSQPSMAVIAPTRSVCLPRSRRRRYSRRWVMIDRSPSSASSGRSTATTAASSSSSAIGRAMSARSASGSRPGAGHRCCLICGPENE